MADHETTGESGGAAQDPTMDEIDEHHQRSARLRVDAEQYAYRILGVAAAVLLTLGTVVYRLLEDWSWIDSFYFSSIAVTTVGFGDLVPTTDAAKLFTVFYVFSGVAIITSFLNVRLKRHARALGANRVARSSEGSPNNA